MKRGLTLSAVATATWLVSVQPAHAGLIDWMQEWSGPGRFAGYWPIPTVTWCPRPYQPASESVQNQHPCFFFEYRHLTAVDGDNFPLKVTAQIYDGGLSWELRRSLELGFGLGILRAGTDVADATRFTISAPRVAIKPLLLFAEVGGFDAASAENARKRRWLSFMKVYTSMNLIGGRLKAEDLGVSASQSSYDRKNEWVPSFGVLIDVGELIRP
jgi:hypothetical protein